MCEKAPLVSIIMNCFNSEYFLKDAIDSIYDQSYTNWEIIFWDNASTDSSASIAKKYDHRLKYFYGEKTKPLGQARNLALAKAKGKYISFLDCDDKYLPNKISSQIAAMEDSNAALSYGSWIEIDNKSEVVRTHKVKKFQGNSFLRLIQKYDVNFQTLMVNREIVGTGNLSFDSELTFSPDFKLVMSIANIHNNILAIDENLAQYRVHDRSLSKKNKKIKLIEFKTTMKFLRSINKDIDSIFFEHIEKIFESRMKLRDSIEDNHYGVFFVYSFKLIYLYVVKLYLIHFKS